MTLSLGVVAVHAQDAGYNVEHRGDWMLKEREEWLYSQLTDNETTDLEARLDGVADHIQWLHENVFQRPW